MFFNGFWETWKDVLNISEAYASSKEVMRKQKISDGWWHRFCEHQNGLLMLRKGYSTSFLLKQQRRPETQRDAEKATRIPRQSRNKTNTSEFVSEGHGTTSNRMIVNEQTYPDIQ